MGRLRIGLAITAAMWVAGAALSQPNSALDIVANTRLQDLMRLCQQQARAEVQVAPGDESRSSEYRQAALDCLRDNKAWYPMK